MARIHKLLLGVALGVCAALIAWAATLTGFFTSVEMKTYDLRTSATAVPATARPDIVLVEIDEQSMRGIEPLVGRWPWPRLVHADVIDYLRAGGATVIGYDVLFAERDTRSGFAVGGATISGAESDRALVDSTAKAGNVIYAADFTSEDAQPPPSMAFPSYHLDDTIERRPSVLPPFPALAAASRGLGSSFFVLDADGPIRWTVPFVQTGPHVVPELGVAAALVAGNIRPSDVRVDREHLWFGGTAMPTAMVRVPRFESETGAQTAARRALIAYRGPAVLADGTTSTYRNYSFYDLFYSQQQILAGEKPKLDPAVFRGKIVFIGLTAAGLHDVFATPFVGSGKMPGIQIHAAVTDQILSGHFVRRAPEAAWLAAIAGCALLVGVVSVVGSSAWIAAAAAVATSILYTWISLIAFRRGLWLPLAAPQLATALAIFLGVGYHYLVEGREKRKVKRLFGRYVSKTVYEQLMADPARARLGGEKREMSVLFSDIRGFTTVSEKGTPEAIVATLNEYFTRMVQVLFEHGGTVDKFVGDMVMALFGAPLDDPDHAEHAVATALAMVEALEVLNAKWTAEGRPTLDIGVGVNSGPMVAGNVGSDTIMSYTVIGDNVNLGSRLESLNKQYGTHVIISENTRAQLKGQYGIVPLGNVVVKGKTKPVAIFQVRTIKDGPPAQAGSTQHPPGGLT